MKFSILKKMWSAFAIILALFIITSAVGLSNITKLTTQYNAIIQTDMEKVELAKALQSVQKETGTLLLEYIMFAKEEALEKIEVKKEERIALVEAITALSDDEQSLELMKKLEAQTVLLFESNDEVVRLKKANGNFAPYSAQSAQINAVVLEYLDELIELQETRTDNTLQLMTQQQSKTKSYIIGIVIFSIAVGVAVAYKMSMAISNPVKQVTAGLAQIAKGNLQVEPLQLTTKDELGLMAETYNKMLQDLQTIVQTVRASSHDLSANAEQLSASSQQSLDATHMVAAIAEQQLELSTEQGEHIEDTAKSMMQLEVDIEKMTADNATMQYAIKNVRLLVEQGAEVVADVTAQMDKIHTTFTDTTTIMTKMAQHSDEIQQVTALITGISEQTNLLALNAAIEAARAGESGKGFAVVADEVRKLAEQSKTSANEIANIVELIQQASNSAVQAISTGGDMVTNGLVKTAQSKEVFTHIENSVDEVVDKVQSVSQTIDTVRHMTTNVVAHTHEIEALAKQVVNNSTDTSAATEQQVASTEEISANAQSLATLAEKLQNEVNHFKL